MNLRRTTTASAMLAAVLASAAAPGWSETLRLEGYGDYVDLALALALPDSLTAGASSTATVAASNAGPGTAETPIVLLSTDQGVQAEGVTGCTVNERPQRQCVLPALAPASPQSASLLLHTDPFARGTVLVGAVVTSEAIEMNPGNEIRVAALPIVAEVETTVTLLSTVPEVLVDGRLAWTIRVDNEGPSGAIEPQFLNFSFAFNGPPVTTECTAVGVASCPGALNYLGPGGQWYIRFVSAPLSETIPSITIEAVVLPRELGNTPGNDGLTLVYRDAFFKDDFE